MGFVEEMRHMQSVGRLVIEVIQTIQINRLVHIGVSLHKDGMICMNLNSFIKRL